MAKEQEMSHDNRPIFQAMRKKHHISLNKASVLKSFEQHYEISPYDAQIRVVSPLGQKTF